MRIEFVGQDWDRFDEVRELLYGVLYRDFGVERGADWYGSTPGGLHAADPGEYAQVAAGHEVVAVALSEHDEVVGTLRLMPVETVSAERQLRQLAVREDVRRQGIARRLVEEIERLAHESGATSVWLHARDTAFPFYERLGYEYESDTFISSLTGIPHRTMRRRLPR